MQFVWWFCLFLVQIDLGESLCLSDGGSATRHRAVSKLQSLGYDTSFGYQDFNTTCKWWSPDCFGENPSSPYGTWNIRTPLLANLSEKVFQIGENDALVFYGCTPPAVRYFSFDLQVFITHDRWIFASVGDAQNMLTLNSSGPTPYNTSILVVTGGDAKTRDDIFKAFASVGVSNDIFNTVPIPDTKKLGTDPLGYGLGHSVWLMALRMAVCKNKHHCEAYKRAEFPILHVKPKKKRTQVPFGLYGLRPRGTGKTEDYLKASLAELISKVVQHHSSLRLASKATLFSFPLNGRVCIKDNENCVGATRDALYMDGDEPLWMTTTTATKNDHHQQENDRNPPVRLHPNGPSWRLSDDADDMLVVVGVIHSKTGKATYINVAPYDVSRELSTGGVVDTLLEGSGAEYLPTNKDAKYLYAYTFKRHCGGMKFCTEIPSRGFPSCPLDKNITFVERAYLEPSTKVGPKAGELLVPVVLHFTSE
eukprot:TRINITY_DN66828_c6_g1_i1.p1 TRINITY_DN66828_c6_g1~~TRINITY_DN66828_c6_g1_i1.p1  ORF type:complete len:478 (+),score=32.67 TRINITY_DN66828_c6_g1_i1:29-1462(+)